MAQLILTHPEGRSKTIDLEGDEISLGRSTANEMSFPGYEGLSRRHLLFEPDGDRWTVRDLESKNGTRVNGVRITEKHILQPGDRISASCVTMTFTDRISQETRLTFEAGASEDGEAFTKCMSLDEVLSKDDSGALSDTRRDRVGAIWAFVRAGRELALNRPLPELFGVVLELSLEAVGAERGVLLTLDEGDRLVIRASIGGEIRISTTVRDRVLKKGTSLLVQDVREHESLQESQIIEKEGVRSLMAVPLQTDRRVIGLIYVDSLEKDDAFASDELQLLTAMANVASIRIERELWEQQKRTLISDNMASLGRLAAALSHEFNSPIGTLKSAVDTLLRAASKHGEASASEQPGLATLQAELRQSIDESLARMQQVIARIQRFTNLDRAATQSVDLNELLGDVIAVVQTDPEIGEGEITLDSQLLPELVCHPHHMSSAFSGLFGFLMKSCREETKPAGEIRVATRAGADRIEIEITGKGSTLSERELARVFDPEFEVARGRVTTGNWSLFTARQLIRDQGGEIDITSPEDGQTRIFVTLPVDKPRRSLGV